MWHYLRDERAGLAAAVLLGERSHLDRDRIEPFVETGTVHLLAISGLHVGILAAALFAALRAQRGFVAEEALASKVGRIHCWLSAAGLDTAVVGVSGGIDSAVVLGLLQKARERPASSLARVVAVVAPVVPLAQLWLNSSLYRIATSSFI